MPGHFPGLAGREGQALGGQVQEVSGKSGAASLGASQERLGPDGCLKPRRGRRPEPTYAGVGRHLQRPLSGVAHGEQGTIAVPLPHHGGQTGMQHQVTAGADAGLPGTEEFAAGLGHRHQAEGSQAVVQRHGQLRLPGIVQDHAALPEQQGIEQFPRRCLAAAPAMGHGLAAVMALAHHLHLGGGIFHLDTAPAHHMFQQFPRLVRLEFQQPFIHCGKGDFSPCRQRPPVGPPHRHPHPGLIPHLIDLVVGLQQDLQPVGRPAHVNRRHAQPEGRLVQVHRAAERMLGRGLVPLVSQTAPPGAEPLGQSRPQRQHRDIDIGRVVGPDGQFHHRLLTGQFGDKGIQHPFPLHRHQGSGLAKGHFHL